MVTESRNLEFTGVLKVVERQLYRRPAADLSMFFRERYGIVQGSQRVEPAATDEITGVFRLKPPGWKHLQSPRPGLDAAETEVSTKVELISRLGEGPRKKFWSRAKTSGQASETEEAPQKVGFFRSWSVGPIQRSIEAIGLRRTERAVPNSKHGMNIVLDRLRKGGLVAVLEGMRMDREMAFAGGGRPRAPEDE